MLIKNHRYPTTIKINVKLIKNNCEYDKNNGIFETIGIFGISKSLLSKINNVKNIKNENKTEFENNNKLLTLEELVTKCMNLI